MTFPKPSNDTVKQSKRAIMKYKNDSNNRQKRRRELAIETGYLMFAPGRF